MARSRENDREERRERTAPHPTRLGEEGPPDRGLEEFICCTREEIRALVGGHYYFIRVREECVALCRVPHLEAGRFAHEVLDHRQHGISDDDLEHAIRMKVGHGFQPGYYEISDHIEKKLRALLDA